MSNSIQTENLSRNFGRVEAVRDLNLVVPQGAIYAMVGPNGAGKTTAIKIMMNILAPTGGHATVLGIDSRKIEGRAFASIGYISENQQLPEWMRVGGLLDYLRPFYPTWDCDLEKDLVRQFDLPLERRLKQLSRGMKMKAALASSLAYRPKLIVLDEPFSGLDPLVRDELIEGLLGLAAESTILISSHDLAEIETFASHVGYLEKGSLRLSEEITTLAERFREVEIAFDTEPTLPKRLPEEWMQLAASACVIRFVDSRFDPAHTAEKISELFANVRDVTFSPMSLRSIFLSMAKASRGAA
jgi:ABC-2 type transport system ATP-binding protein